MFLENYEPRRPKVGVAVLIQKDEKFLFGKRLGKHGGGLWASPGGHLEFNESFEECAAREVLEETGLEIENIRYFHATNDVMLDVDKHYITVFMLADWKAGEPQNLEPHKCDGWHWFDWDGVPEPSFVPHNNLKAAGMSPVPEVLVPIEKSQIEQTKDFVRAELAGAEAGHDIEHIMRVYRNAKLIAKDEECNLFIVELAALLHDIADHKFHGGDTEVGAQKTGEWLSSINVEPSTIEAVQNIVRHISFKSGRANLISTIEGRVVQDADRLDAMGAIGVARAFSYGGDKRRPLYSDNDSQNTINHFYEKLLLLKDLMNTEAGKKIAEPRHEFLESYLEQFLLEWNGEPMIEKLDEDYKTLTVDAYNKHAELWAEKFDKHFDGSVKSYAESFISELRGSSVADVGCGAGSASVYLKNRGLLVDCLDISPAFIEICKSKGLNARIFDIEKDDLGVEAYDGVWSHACLLHLKKKNVPMAIEKIARAIKSGGVFALTLKNGEGEGFEDREQFPQTKRWFSYFSHDEIRNLVEPYFEIISVEDEEVKNTHGTNKYIFSQYLLRKK